MHKNLNDFKYLAEELDMRKRLFYDSPNQMTRRFPIMDGPSIPWALIEPHERQALKNHNQSLVTLASRGGLSPMEAVAVLTDRHWREVHGLSNDEALAQFKAIVDADLRTKYEKLRTAASEALKMAERMRPYAKHDEDGLRTVVVFDAAYELYRKTEETPI